MTGQANYPTALDDNTSLHDVIDSTTPIVAAHHNNTKEAVKALEARVGIYSTGDASSIDYRLGSATDSHVHNGASGQGQPVQIPSAANRHSVVLLDNTVRTAIASQMIGPYIAPRTMWLEAIEMAVIRGPSGGTSILDVNIGATSVWYSAASGRLMMAPVAGRAIATSGPLDQVTVASGTLVTVDLDQVGTNVGYDRAGIVFVFRE